MRERALRKLKSPLSDVELEVGRERRNRRAECQRHGLEPPVVDLPLALSAALQATESSAYGAEHRAVLSAGILHDIGLTEKRHEFDGAVDELPASCTIR